MDGPFPEGMAERMASFLASDPLRDDVFAEDLLFPLQRKREMYRMLRAVGSVRCYLDVGSDKGGGLFVWLKTFPLRRVAACEVRGLPYRGAFEAAFPRVDFLWVEGSSYDAANVTRVREWLNDDRFDAAFLDGDKSMFLEDYKLYSPMVNGPVVMHDVQDPAPGEAYRAVLARGVPGISVVDCSELLSLKEPRNSYEHWLKHWNGSSCGYGILG